ncbi:Hypothetical predicted protein, partial [Mytilus galloprovincialis]
ADDDGDTVRCRWAKSTPYDECSGVCNTLSGSYLDEAKCFLKYNATRSVGWFAVALQLEDFRSPMDTIPLSSVSLQFLVYVFHSTESCTSRPVFPPNIITDGSVHHILANDIFNVSIYARSGAETLRVTAINTVSPIGMTKSELYPHGTSGREWFVVVTWIPTLGQTGSHVFCFTAVDNIGQTSDQICGTLVVHGETLPPTVTTKSTTTTATKVTTTANTAATTALVTANTTTTITEKPPPQTTTPLTTNMPDNSTSSTDSVVDVIPPSEVNNVLVAGVAVGGLAIFGVSAFAIARFLGLGKSAQIWASSLKPDKSMINTNVNADNFNTLDYKGEYVSTTPAKSHAFSKTECVLKYNATGLTGWYAVSLQIEDFLSPMDTIPLSSVPLQFLVVVTNSSENCTSRPVFPANIITDGSVQHVLVNNIFNVSIYARSGAETLWLTTINTVSPFGMIKSELYQHDTIEREWFVVVTWIPTLSQTGSHVFCFTAVDNIG